MTIQKAALYIGVDGGGTKTELILVDAAGAIVARGHNRREAAQDPTAHAEIEALRRGDLDVALFGSTGEFLGREFYLRKLVTCPVNVARADNHPLSGRAHLKLADLRGEVMQASQRAEDADHLRRECEGILTRHFRVEHATILALQGGHFAGEGIRIARDRAGFNG